MCPKAGCTVVCFKYKLPASFSRTIAPAAGSSGAVAKHCCHTHHIHMAECASLKEGEELQSIGAVLVSSPLCSSMNSL
jgi:hypothetical protein